MHPPLLSIIIPTYNSEKHLRTCLDSIFSQTFKNFEVIAIDGASNDGTVELLKQYTTSNSNMRYLSEKDSGIYDAMNKGVGLAKTEWVYFIGSDDRLYEHTILESVFAHTDLNYDVIYGNVDSEMLGGIYDGEFTIEKIFSRNICHQAIFFRKSIFSRTGLFDTRFKAHADWHHNLKWLRDGRIRKLYIDKLIAYFAPGGVSTNHKDKLFEHIINWEKAKYQKKDISRINRLRMTKAALQHAMSADSTRFFFKVLVDTPLFIL
ncbi:MAG TPA: glycosyltransferase family 2 protein [Mucilaginibacter sp.]